MATRLTKKEQGFVKDYLDTGNGTKAVLMNYDTTSENSAGAISSQNLRRIKIQEYLADHAEQAESKIFHLSQKAKSEMVSYVASKDIMDRAGFKPVEKTESRTLNVDMKIDNKELAKLDKEYEEKVRKLLLDGKRIINNQMATEVSDKK